MADGKTKRMWESIGYETIANASYVITVSGDRIAFWRPDRVRPRRDFGTSAVPRCEHCKHFPECTQADAAGNNRMCVNGYNVRW